MKIKNLNRGKQVKKIKIYLDTSAIGYLDELTSPVLSIEREKCTEKKKLCGL